MEELGDDKLESGEKDSIEAAIKALEEVLKGEDKEAIEAKTKDLTDASGKMAERLYAEKGAEGGATAEGAAEAGSEQANADDDVVDAEFEEVDDSKK